MRPRSIRVQTFCTQIACAQNELIVLERRYFCESEPAVQEMEWRCAASTCGRLIAFDGVDGDMSHGPLR
jgi:hypothetical protein